VTYSGPDGSRSALVLFATDDGARVWRADRVLPHLGETSPGQRVPSTVVGAALIAATTSGGTVTLALVSTDGEVGWIRSGRFKEPPDLSFADKSHGWASSRNGMFSTTDGGASWTEVTPARTTHPASPQTKPARPTAESGFTVSPTPGGGSRAYPNAATGPSKEVYLGFDSRQALSSTQMNTWWNYSPYYEYQISLAGAAKWLCGCTPSPLKGEDCD
jgi:photosystem II stability/assembly factor-like uncharacterized protein